MALFAEWLLANLPAFLRLLPKDKLIAMALQLGTRMGVAVEATIPGIMAAVRGWVQANPQLSLVVANVAVMFGFQIADNLLSKLTDEDEGSSVSKAALVVKERLRRYRSENTGDGLLDSVNGRSSGEAPESADETAVVNGIIDIAVRSMGSFDMFMAVRTAMFLEDEELEAYRLSLKNKLN